MLKPVVGITLGDPGGIGPEVIVKTLLRRKAPNFYPVVFGVPEVFESLKKKIRDGKIGFWDVSEEAARLFLKYSPSPSPLPLGGEGKDDREKYLRIVPGKVAVSNACIAYAALKMATKAACERKIQAIVTAPVNKTAMRLVDPHFHGHTEYLAHVSGSKKFAMMFVAPRLKVTLVTIHVPVRQVSRLIRKALVFEKIKLTHDFLKKYFQIQKPRLAVCALNPHGKETGHEDEAEIRPAVLQARRAGIRAEGPLPGDQVFYEAYHGHFDAVLSMYHDQGLAPFKMIAFRDGVNVTLGLPFIRTSPDHGTAFDIAGQGKADPVSFQSALSLAVRLVNSAGIYPRNGSPLLRG